MDLASFRTSVFPWTHRGFPTHAENLSIGSLLLVIRLRLVISSQCSRSNLRQGVNLQPVTHFAISNSVSALTSPNGIPTKVPLFVLPSFGILENKKIFHIKKKSAYISMPIRAVLILNQLF